MTATEGSLAERVIAGDRRAASRLMTRAESGDPDAIEILQRLYLAGGNALVVGMTGPPGAGKSTLIDQLITALRTQGKRVAILAVDPSSPFSGGAVLGDRVRMGRHAEDREVFIRSMAARGKLGGLAPATGDALTILDAMNFDVIIVETVGVGQSEIDILSHADAIVLLQTAHGGDGIQIVKAGILEIADILIVNKADSPGTDRMVRGLTEMAAHASRMDSWTAPVIKTEATNGLGIDRVIEALDAHVAHRLAHPVDDLARRQRQVRARVLALAEAALRHRLQRGGDAAFEARIDQVVTRDADPHTLVRWLVADRTA